MKKLKKYFTKNKVQIIVVALLLIVSAFSSCQCVKTTTEVKALKIENTDLTKTVSEQKKTIKAWANTDKTRKEYDEKGRLRAEETTSRKAGKDTNETTNTATERMVSTLMEENTKLKRELSMSSKGPNWAVGATSDFTNLQDVDRMQGTRKIVRVLGAEVWGGAAYSFEEKKVRPAAEVKF